LLLKDLRVNVNKPNHNQLSPLSYASQEGHLSVLQSILASGRALTPGSSQLPALLLGTTRLRLRLLVHKEPEQRVLVILGKTTRRQQNGPLIATLLDSFEQDSQQVRAQLRKQLDFPGSIFFFLLLFLLSF